MKLFRVFHALLFVTIVLSWHIYVSATPLLYGDSFTECDREGKCEWARCLMCKDACRKDHCFWGKFFGNVLYDVADIHANLFTLNSFKVASFFFPLIATTRIFDSSIHHHFYDRSRHKNRNQPPDWCESVAKTSIGIPIVFFGLKAFFQDDRDFAFTTRMYLLGMPFVIWTKSILKEFEFDINKRPWNEHFSCKKRAYGGFPSGHMAEAVYTAVLYGMRFGPRYAIPTGLLAAVVGASFIACNRHYLSQVVAGAGLGVLYAYAVDNVIEKRMKEYNVQVGVEVNEHGHPAVSVGFDF